MDIPTYWTDAIAGLNLTMTLYVAAYEGRGDERKKEVVNCPHSTSEVVYIA